MFESLTRNWWTFAVQGLAALVFGVLTLLWPGISLVAMIALFGAFAIVTGVMHMVGSYDAAKQHLHWGTLLAVGILDVVAGLVTWFWPGLTAYAVLYLVVAWALFTGILYVVASVELRDLIPHAWHLLFTGLLSLALAALLAFNPRSGILSLVLVVGIYAIATGISELVFAFRLHNVGHEVSKTATRLARTA
jgi:uncharacterized membrane protein HdeD (DUF308 family)